MNDRLPVRYNEQIDLTLRLVGSAVPAPGMEGRILVQLDKARLDEAGTQARAVRLFSFPQLAVGVAATVIGGVVIIGSSVVHSRHMLPVAPGIHLPIGGQAGVGAASAAHVATHPVTAVPDGRPRSVQKTENGRAVIAPDAKKRNGVAVPKSPVGP